MAFTEFETESILKQLEDQFWAHRRPPLDARDEITDGQRIEGQVIDLFFNRVSFHDPSIWREDAIARIRYIKSRDCWAIYWQRANMKWISYEPCPETKTLSEALAIIREDAYACFLG
jgi:hypothetical protein